MNAAEREKGLLKLRIRDFGPIVDADIDLRPLTLFVGPSNTGKSYLAVLIYALQRLRNLRASRSGFHAQTRSRKFRRAADEARDEFLSWARAAAASGAGAGWADAPLPDRVAGLVRSALSADDGDFSGLAEAEFSRCFSVAKTDRLIRRSARKPSEVVLRHFVETGHEQEKPFQHAFSFSRGKSASLASTIPEGKPLYVDRRAARDLKEGFRWTFQDSQLPLGELFTPERLPMHAAVQDLAEAVFPHVFGRSWNSSHYLPADRAGAMHAHRAVVSALVSRAADPAFRQESLSSTLSGVLADFLQRLIVLERPGPFPKGKGRSRRGEDLAARLEKEILSGAVRMESLPGLSYPEFFYRPEGWKDDLPLMRASSMVSELAPVVLYLRHVVRIGDTLIIDEPEAHLHPAKQVAFMRSLAAMVKAGIRVIMTTHSEWVLEELANLVRASALSDAEQKAVGVEEASLRREDVGAWLFRPKPGCKGSEVREINLDSESRLYPVGYDDVAFELHNRGVEIDGLAGTNAAA